MLSEKLKPCPHCGEADELYPAYRTDKDGKCIEPPYGIDCLGCGTDFTPREGRDAIAAWNRRALEATGEAKPVVLKGAPVTITYTNWRGETDRRNILPIRMWFGSTEWHQNPQWLITARDMDKGVERDFALLGIAAPVPATPAQGWRSMDSAPRDGTAIWLLIEGQPMIGYGEKETVRHPDQFIAKFGFRRSDEDFPDDVYGTSYRADPTAWMPLPTPPAGGSE